MKIRSYLATFLICYLLLFNVGAAYSMGAAPPAFTDVKGSFAEQAIGRLTRQGVVQGKSAAQFAPAEDVTRLQFTILVARVLGIQPLFPSEPRFADISADTPEAGYLEALAGLGLIKGMAENTFAGDLPMRRQDVAVILRNALTDPNEASAGPNTYKDAGKISAYALDSVNAVTEKGWMKGNNGNFYPLRNLTRAEAAVLIDRLLESRKDQALKALQVSETSLKLKTRETKDIGLSETQSLLGFTPVIGTDNQEIYSMSADGKSVTANQAGKGTITANAGLNSTPLDVEITEVPSTTTILSSVPEVLTPDARETVMDVTYAIYEQTPDAGFKAMEDKIFPRTPEGLSLKTDAWTGFYRQQGRDIIVDLGAITPVSRMSLEFLQNSGSGIYFPKSLKGSLSIDGRSWYQLGNAYHPVDPSDKTVQQATLSLAFPSVNARYLKLSFPVDVMVQARHLQVYGGVPAEKPVILALTGGDAGSGGACLQDPDIQNILLIPTGSQSDQQILTSNEALPLVAYVSPQGKINGRMFDTMLFLPYGKLPCTRDSWTAYLEDLFTPGQQLSALEDTVAQVNTAAGENKKEQVILALPYPDPNQTAFDSQLSFSEKLVGKEQAAKNRLEAVQWYYNKLMEKWNNAGFTQLTLKGIYWYGETIYSNYQESDLVQKTALMIRNSGQNFFWIPYYGAQGYADWESYGFTHVYLQPNFYAAPAPPADRMDWAAESARKYGTGIEIEMDDRVFTLPEFYALFYQELNKAHELGLDQNTAKAYYIGLKGTIIDAATSGYPEVRKIYDDLYRFMNGTYK